jgi:hypothetical protein
LDSRFKEACAAVGHLIEPTDTPRWLTDYFVYWATPLASEWSVAGLQPTKKEMRRRLTSIYEGADALDEALSDPVTMAFVERTHAIGLGEKLAGLRESLRSICEYAYVASKSPALSTKAGKTKRGRGKTPVLGAVGPKTFCALIVAEAWKSVHGKYPASKNVGAAKAALAFWGVSGGAPVAGWGKKRFGAWRPYFESAQGPEFELTRAECSRILGAVKSRDLKG